MKFRRIDARADLPAVLLLLAVAAALFVYVPGAADPGGDVRAAVVLVCLLLAAFAARHLLAQRLPGRVALIALAIFAAAVLVSVLRAADPLRALWGSPVLWTGSATLLLALALAVILPAAALTGGWRNAFPVGILALLTLHQAVFGLRTFFPALAVPSADVLSFGAPTPTQIALFSVVGLVLAAGFSLAAGRSTAARGALAAVALLHLVVLMRIDRPAAWLVLFVGLVLLLAQAVWRFDQVHRISANVAFVLAACALVLTFVRLPPPAAVRLPVEVNPRQRDVASAAVQLWRYDALGGAFGAGPGGFGNAFGRYRPASLNRTVLWNVRLPAAPSTALQLLFEIGAIGVAALAVVIGAALAAGWRRIGQQPQVRGIRKVFARRVGPAADGALAAAGVFAATGALVAAAFLWLLPPAALLLAALFAGWLLADEATDKPARPPAGRLALVTGWISTGVLALAAAALLAAGWLAAAQRAAGSLLAAREAEAQDRAYAATVRLSAAPEWHAAAALQALQRAAAATDADTAAAALGVALERARAAADPRHPLALEAAITVGMQAAAAGAQLPELEAWLAAARAAEPGNPVFVIAAGDLAGLRGDAAGAEAAYREAVRLAPELTVARARLSGLLERQTAGTSTTAAPAAP